MVPVWQFPTVVGFFALLCLLSLYFASKESAKLKGEKKAMEEQNGKLATLVSQLTNSPRNSKEDRSISKIAS
jgi:hypothetical protein